jgi:nitrogen-specific signal transduction histidine kinase
MDKGFFETEVGKNPFMSFLNRSDVKNPLSGREKSFLNGQNAAFLWTFFIELVHRFKNTLGSIKTFTHLSKDKLENVEFREYFYKIINEDIEEIEGVLNSLLNYIKINTPILKTNTVHSVLEEVLRRYGSQLEEKKIQVIKKFDKDLPETIVHEAQLRYILNSLLEYAIPITFSNGSIGFLTKTLEFQKETPDGKTLVQKDGRCIEIVMVFTGAKKTDEKFEAVLGTMPIQKEETVDLKLLLVKEIIRKNKGVMKCEVNEKKPRTFISLMLPVERRRVVSYQLAES